MYSLENVVFVVYSEGDSVWLERNGYGSEDFEGQKGARVDEKERKSRQRRRRAASTLILDDYLGTFSSGDNCTELNSAPRRTLDLPMS